MAGHESRELVYISVKCVLEELDCPLCGTRNYIVLQPAKYPADLTREDLLKVYSASSGYMLVDQLVRCKDCLLVYLNPRIPQNVILNAYKEAVDPTFIRQNEQRIKTFKRSLRYLISRYGLKASPHARILDVGCAGGAFPKAAADLNFSVIGVEPSVWLAEQGRKAYGLDIRSGMLTDQDFSEASFDLVTLWDVIEHLTNPGDVVDDIHRILKDGGLLVVNYPDYDSSMRRVLNTKWPFLLSVHLIYFTPSTIARFLDDHGFAVEEVRPFWQTLELGYIMERAAAYFSIIGAFEKAVRFFNLHRMSFTYNMGQSFLVARKKV